MPVKSTLWLSSPHFVTLHYGEEGESEITRCRTPIRPLDNETGELKEYYIHRKCRRGVEGIVYHAYSKNIINFPISIFSLRATQKCIESQKKKAHEFLSNSRRD